MGPITLLYDNMAGGGDDQGRVAPIGGEKPGAGEVAPLREEQANVAPEAGRQPLRGESQTQRADQFRQAGRLEQFVRAITERIEHGWLYQTFRLPGSSRVVHDRRESGRDAGEAEGEQAQRAESKGGFQLKEGRLQEAPPKSYQNYFAGRDQPRPSEAGAKSQEERPLSGFENKLVERFEGAKEHAKASPDGKAHFLQKTATQWKEFFLKFLHRSEKKSVPLEVVSDELTFRGLFKKGNDPAKGVVISDFKLADGTHEKFARFDVTLKAALAEMAQMQPGAALAKQAVAKGVQGEVLEYIAIGAPRGEGDIAAALRDTQGVFTNLKTEAEIAKQLGLMGQGREGVSARSGLQTSRSGGRRAGAGKLFGQEEEVLDDQAGRFVPWWRWDREERIGQRRWFTGLTIALTVTILALGFWLLLRAVR